MKKPKLGLRRGLAVLLASLFVLSMYATGIAQANASKMQLERAITGQKEVCGAVQGLNITNHSTVATVTAVMMPGRPERALPPEISARGDTYRRAPKRNPTQSVMPEIICSLAVIRSS